MTLALAALLSAVAAAAPPDPYPSAAAAYVVVRDGRVLWERHADAPRAPGSLVKLMTAIVVLEGDWDPEAVVVASASAAATPGARLGLSAGDRMRAGDLLTAMLVRSANDAAVALAEHAAEDVPSFVERMNRRARELGLEATRFANPTGLDAEGQVTSARDVARLADVAMGLEPFASRVALERAVVRTLGGRRFELKTSNALLGRLPGARGVKTGYTRAAGKCVVADAVRDGRRVLLVLLDAPDRWWSADAMVRAAFDAPDDPR